MITTSSTASAIRGSTASAAAMLLSGPTGTRVTGVVTARSVSTRNSTAPVGDFAECGSGRGSVSPCMSFADPRS